MAKQIETAEAGHTGGLAVDPNSYFDRRNVTKYVVDPYDPNPDLRFPYNVAVYDEMRTTDGQIGSMLNAATLPIMAANWRLEGADVRPEVMTFVKQGIGLLYPGETLNRKRKQGIVFSEHLAQACLCLPFGFMPFEQVYAPVPATPEQEASFGTPVLLHLRKLAPRLPRTVAQIHVGRDGGLAGISQTPLGGEGLLDFAPVFIPVDNLVMYTLNKEGADWAGRSILRQAYKHWLINEKLIRLNAQIAERNGMGVPVISADDAILPRADAEAIIENFRAGAQAGVALPNGATFTLQGVAGQTVDLMPQIKYHDEKIAASALAMFLTLGHDAGARSLGETFVDVFTQSLQSLADAIAATFTEHVIRDLVELNFGPDEAYPTLSPGRLSDNKEITSTAIKELVDAGIVVPDDKLEEHVRRRNGLPVADTITSRKPLAPAPAAPVAPAPAPAPAPASAALSAPSAHDAELMAKLDRIIELRGGASV
ncbi:portal protein [Arthrobacter phage Abba]|uniref:Portal protein n=1 Tax=Arthrobacter phage Abba TaxID=2713256 RepID=A0A6G8R2B7_9CAUD|nr:portal protein [Arthrobacter phage Abba]QIN94332.1 portal protein [Arthrobacter phage Abba]